MGEKKKYDYGDLLMICHLNLIVELFNVSNSIYCDVDATVFTIFFKFFAVLRLNCWIQFK